VFVALSKILDLAVEPLAWALVLGLLALVLHRRGRTPWVLGALAVAVVAVFSVGSVASRVAGLAERGVRSTVRSGVVYDAAVVLSGMVDEGASRASGSIELTGTADRITRAFELWRAGRVRHLLLSGGMPFPAKGGVPEPERLRELLLRWGVPPDAIVMETRSRNTRESAIESARLAAAHGFRSIVLVTSAAHVPRAMGCFRAVGLSPDVLAVDRRAGGNAGWLPRSAALDESTRALRELGGRLAYWVVGYTR
jgi:uncharacterized SAM-binding protein YcdF (DUF218 family)